MFVIITPNSGSLRFSNRHFGNFEGLSFFMKKYKLTPINVENYYYYFFKHTFKIHILILNLYI